MFNKDVIKFLSLINGVTNTVIMKYPQTVALSEEQDVMLLFDVSKMDQDQFENFGLKNSLDEFLKLVALFPEDREINMDGNSINVTSGDMSSSFITDKLALMDAWDRDASQFDKTEAVPSVCTFDLSPDDVSKIQKSTNVFKDLTEVVFKSQDDDMMISLAATNKFNAKSNTFSVTKPCNASKEFEIKIPKENFCMLPASEYQVDVKYNASKNAYRIFMSNKSFDGFKLMLSVKA